MLRIKENWFINMYETWLPFFSTFVNALYIFYQKNSEKQTVSI